MFHPTFRNLEDIKKGQGPRKVGEFKELENTSKKYLPPVSRREIDSLSTL